MPNPESPKFTIVGAGLGGALLALYLGRAGYQVEVFERRPDPRSGRVEAGRSINLALSTRGLNALCEVGLADEIMRIAIPMRGRMLHSPTGELTEQPYDKDPNRAINSVSRAGLNLLLIERAAALPNVQMHFECRCVDLNLDTPSATLRHEQTHAEHRSSGDILIGFDGAFSAVRDRMRWQPGFDYSQSYLEHGYKELHIPPPPGGGFRMERNALHIWPRKRYMMIALPNPDGSFTVTCFWPLSGPNGFDSLKSEADIVAYFKQHFPDSVPMLPTLVEDYKHNPVGRLVTVKCGPWHHADKVLLLGDAAHAIVPFYGQGMNCAFEDCTVFMQCVRECAPDWRRVLEKCYELRKPNADVLADLALHNFIEMRDLSASKLFQWRKKLERTLHKWIPRWYTPLYTMVSFTRTPYREAVERARRQDRIVATVGIVLGVLIVCLLFWAIRAVFG